MKTKGKKADKKKAILNKEAEYLLVEAPVILANVGFGAQSDKGDPKPPTFKLEAAPIEVLPQVLHEKPVLTAPTVKERRKITPEERRRLISMAAYDRAQRVGFGKTNPVEDWLLAEREIDAMIGGGASI